MDGAVYIHTRDRLQFLEKSLPKWATVLDETAIGLYLVVEPNEVKKHARFLKEHGLLNNVNDIIPLPKRNMGMGWSRQVAYEHANEMGLRSFITTDDDMYPRESPELFLESATRVDVLGVGCWFSIYGLLTPHEQGTGLQPIYNGQGKRCMAINTDNMSALSTAGFPTYFKGYDDHELQRLGIQDLGLHWWVDTDYPCTSIAAIGDPGGMCSLPGYNRVVDRKHTAHILTHERYPEFVSNPEKCDPDSGRCSYTMQWKKFHKAHDVPMEG